MKPLTKLYIKAFLLTGIPYGLLMLAFGLIGSEGRLWKFLVMTIGFGIIMSLTLVTLHRYRLKKIGVQEITDENIRVGHTKNFKSGLNKNELIEKLKSDPIIGKMKIKEIENGVLVKTGINLMTWGEKIKIILQSDRDPDFEYKVSSHPIVITTLVDYGKNLQNVNRIEKLIKIVA